LKYFKYWIKINSDGWRPGYRGGVYIVSIGENVKRIRKEQRYTQTEIARRCGVTPAAISGLEHGDFTPSASLLARLARALDVSADELLEDPSEVLLSAIPPQVEQWLEDLNARFLLMSDERFEDEVVLGDPRELIHLLREERDKVEHELENYDLAKELFPAGVASKATKKERIAEAMRPFRELSRLKVLISREYGIKERTAENYRRHLDLISAESSVSEEVRRSAFREERELAFAL
jgi:putative transcriptional regulator